jgi:LPXTG-motif cell wall-anchored protein
MFLEARTTVVVKTQPTSDGNGHGVAGVSTSRTPPAGDGTGSGASPNSGSSSALANTGTRENPLALTQVALLAMLAGVGLLVVTRRRRLRKH